MKLAYLILNPSFIQYFSKDNKMYKLIYLLIMSFCSTQLVAAELNNNQQKKPVAQQSKANPTNTKVETAVTAKSVEPSIASERAFDRAMLLVRAGDMDAAHKDFSLAIEKSPNYASAYSNRALVNYHLGNKTRAMDDFNKAISIEPNNPIFRYQLAAYYSLNNQVDIGLDTLEKALDLGFAKNNNAQISALKLTDVGDPDLDNLKKSKKASGRLQDLADLEKLEE